MQLNVKNNVNLMLEWDNNTSYTTIENVEIELENGCYAYCNVTPNVEVTEDLGDYFTPPSFSVKEEFDISDLSVFDDDGNECESVDLDYLAKEILKNITWE